MWWYWIKNSPIEFKQEIETKINNALIEIEIIKNQISAIPEIGGLNQIQNDITIIKEEVVEHLSETDPHSQYIRDDDIINGGTF